MSDDLAQYPARLVAAAERLDHVCDSELVGWDHEDRIPARLAASHRLLSAAVHRGRLKIDPSDPGTPSPLSLRDDADLIMYEHLVSHGEHHPARDEWLSAWATYEIQLTYVLLDLLCGSRDYGLTDRLTAASTPTLNREHS